jgi:hypothetical protein
MSSSDAPPAPDYVGAANAQGAANVEAAIASGHINNPTVTNPYGTQTVSWDGYNPYIVQRLSPSQQQILDKSTALKNEMLDTGAKLSYAVSNNSSMPLDFSAFRNASAPDRLGYDRVDTPADVVLGGGEKYRSDAINAIMNRVNTDTAGQRDAKNSELIAAGIRPGTKAYEAAMTQIDRQYNDARDQAILAGGQAAQQSFAIDQGARQQQMSDFNAKQAANVQNFGLLQNANQNDFAMRQEDRKQAIAEMLTRRQTPINEISALTSGTQVNNPFAGGLGYQAGANVGAANIAGAVGAQGQYAQNAYNQQQAMTNGNIGAGAGLLGSLGSAYMMGPGSR